MSFKTLKTRNHFSKPQLLIFALAFGIIGILIWRTFAAPNPNLPGDLNSDNTVNITDLSILLSNYGTSNSTADINNDATVNILDLSILLSHYGQSYVLSNIFYVSATGNDANNGSLNSPWLTIQKAADTVPSGSTINVRSGTYSHFTITKAGITITNYPGENPLIQGQSGVQDVINISANNVTVSGMTVFGCVPNPSPPGSFEDAGSSAVRINDNTTGVSVSHMEIRDSHGTNSDGLPFGCYGVLVHYATGATVSDNNIYHNGYGVFIRGGGGLRILNNSIHDNDVIIRNTASNGNDDYGASAIGFDLESANPGATAQGNTMYNNVGPSHDYGTDGGGFEVYQASNIIMTSNTIYNNDNVIETGADAGGSCSNNQFTNNTVGTSTRSTGVGLLLRCAQNMLVDSNSLSNIKFWTFDIVGGGSFASSISGLTITNNTITQNGDKVYALETNPSGLGMNINNNHFHVVGSTFATNWDGTSDSTQAAWFSKTGFDAASTTF